MMNRELQTAQREKQEILAFEGHLAAASTKQTITESSSLLLSQLTSLDPQYAAHTALPHACRQDLWVVGVGGTEAEGAGGTDCTAADPKRPVEPHPHVPGLLLWGQALGTSQVRTGRLSRAVGCPSKQGWEEGVFWG